MLKSRAMAREQYARKFEVVWIEPLGDGRFLVYDYEGHLKYEIDEATLNAEYEEV